MKTRGSRFARVVAAAVVAGAVALGPIGLTPAGADLSAFSATGTGFALRVTVDLSGLPDAAKTAIGDAYSTAYGALPAAAQAELPSEFPFVIDQYFAKTTSEASNSVTKAVSKLGEGFVDLPSVSADQPGQDNSQSVQSVVLPPADQLDISVLDAVTGALKATVQAGPKVDGQATIAQVNATLANVASMLPAELQGAFQTVVDAVNATITDAQAQLNQTLATAADEAEAAVAGTPLGDTLADNGIIDAGGVVDGVQDLAASIVLPQIPNPMVSGLAEVTEIDNVTTAQKTTDGKSSADAVSSIKSVDVLQGFVSVGLINLASHSEAAGVAGSASNSSSCSLADVRLGDTAGVSLDGSNLYVDVAGEPVAVPVVGQTVADLKAQIDGLLAQAGMSVELCDAAQAAAAQDGSSASQSVSAFRVTFEPKVPAGVDLSALGLNEGDSLIKVVIDPTVQTAVSAQPQVSQAQLPRTGAPLAATVLSGLALTVGALSLRRRIR